MSKCTPYDDRQFLFHIVPLNRYIAATLEESAVTPYEFSMACVVHICRTPIRLPSLRNGRRSWPSFRGCWWSVVWDRTRSVNMLLTIWYYIVVTCIIFSGGYIRLLGLPHCAHIKHTPFMLPPGYSHGAGICLRQFGSPLHRGATLQPE